MDLDTVKAIELAGQTRTYTKMDTILYNLGIGYGRDPLDRSALPFFYEDALKAVPSMSVVLSYPGPWMRDPATTINYAKMLHGEQAFEIHRPLAASATVRCAARITGAIDKGADKGAILGVEWTMSDGETDEPIATNRQNLFLRDDGGCGSFGMVHKLAEPVPPGSPDRIFSEAIPEYLPLIYRLSGDLNPIHVDPSAARTAGFERPILHGLATLGIATRVILHKYCDNDPARFTALCVRFSRPALPGDTLQFEFFEGADGLRFRAVAVERQQTILDGCSAKVRS